MPDQQFELMRTLKFYRKAGLVSAIFFISVYTLAAQIKSYKKLGDGVLFTLTKGFLKIKICKEDIIEVKYTILDSFSNKQSLVVNKEWPSSVNFNVKDEGAAIIINTGKLLLNINKESEAISYLDLNGNIITKEDQQEGKKMIAQTVAGINTYSCETKFISPADEALFGLGCHPLDSLSVNYKGRDQELIIQYLTGAIPVMLSTKGFGLLWDNYAASKFYGTEAANTKFKYVSESGKEIDYYFFYGPSFDQIIYLYRTASGNAPMFPKWAFGLFQSQDRYKSQAEVLSVKDKYRSMHIPVDAIVQDWFYWEPLPIGSHVMAPQRYPDPKAMVDELHKANFHAMISIWPVFGNGTADFDALKKIGGLTSITWDNFFVKTFDTYYDAHNPAARDLYWKQASDSLIKRYGWDAWWVDQCEPDNGALLDERRKANLFTGKGIDYFNTYSLMHSEGLYKNWRKDIQGKRAFFLIRQSFAGEQRNAATLWSSDITTTFASFKCQVPQAVNACASGIPYWTSDIGGYLSRTSPDGIPDWSAPQMRELFIRWFQFGTFSPIFRIHGKGERAIFSKNWDDKTRQILLKYDNLRYRLLPYIYSLAAKVTMDNYTILRSLAFDFRNDKKVFNIQDQYMFGPAFLVNPVTEQLFTGKDSASKEKSRKIYLPVPASWFDFWTGEKFTGGQTITVSAPLEKLPLFVKEGSIVPMGKIMEYATEKAADTIELRIYPGASGEFRYYEDENDNYNYENGKYATIDFNWNDTQKELTVSDTKGSFEGMLKNRVFNIVIVKQNHGTGEQVTGKTDKSVSYSGNSISIKF
jgi:alpha-D-xyloside xylohydrolase